MKALAVVPVFNEWPHLRRVLEDLRNHSPHIMVVDDGSHDKSFLHHLRAEGFPYLSYPFNLGHWAAVQAGFRYALMRGYEAAISFDGDGQHLGAEIDKLLGLLDQGYDVVIGENSARGGMGKRLGRAFLGRLSGLQITDFTSGFRGYSRKAMQCLTTPALLNLEYQDLGVLFMARQAGLKMVEVPVRMEPRLDDISRVFPNLRSVLRYLLITLTFILARKP